MKIIQSFNNKIQLHSFVLVFPLVLLTPQTNIQAAQTTRVSVSSSGNPANDFSDAPFVSPDGRYLTFSSDATNLVTGDTNSRQDVFVRERLTGITTRVSLTSGGAQANNHSFRASITPDGRYVVFTSEATNLVSGDTNGFEDVFVRDRAANTTTRVNISSSGAQANGYAFDPSISSDGRYVAFTSSASNLVNGDTNGQNDIFVRDRVANTTTRVNISTLGAQANENSYFSSITPDGRYVAFTSLASNLVNSDTNGHYDIFVRDRVANTTTRVNFNSAGTQTNGGSAYPFISADGRFVAFTSWATNLINGDTNNSADVFIRDRVASATTRVSVDPSGIQWALDSIARGISSDGRYVTFLTGLWGDSFPDWDVFIRDRSANKTTQINVSSTGVPDQGLLTWGGDISADGRFVGFMSDDGSLVAGGIAFQHSYLRDKLLNTSKTADLQVSVLAPPASIVKGQNGNYTLKIKNNSAIIAQYIWLTDVISNGTLVGITPSTGTCSKATISICRIPSLAPGASANITLSIKANANALTQLIFLNAAPKDNAPSNNTLKVSTPVI